MKQEQTQQEKNAFNNGCQLMHSFGFDQHGYCNFTGLTKREHFAGLAMQGLMTAQNQNGKWQHDIKECARISVAMADALLLELEKIEK